MKTLGTAVALLVALSTCPAEAATTLLMCSGTLDSHFLGILPHAERGPEKSFYRLTDSPLRFELYDADTKSYQNLCSQKCNMDPTGLLRVELTDHANEGITTLQFVTLNRDDGVFTNLTLVGTDGAKAFRPDIIFNTSGACRKADESELERAF